MENDPTTKTTTKANASSAPFEVPSHAESRTAIENLLFRYAEAIDAGDFAGVGKLFEKGRIAGADGQITGEGKQAVEAIYENSTKLFEDGTPKTQHVTTNLIFEFAEDGRSARVRSRFTVFQGFEGFALQPIIAGHYADTFAYTPADGWHFIERRMRPVLLGDLSRHLKFDIS